MYIQRIITISTLLFLICAAIAFPAQLSENLLTALDNADSQDKIDVLIFMANQLDLKKTEAVFKLGSSSRHARHKIMIDQLQELSEKDQQELKKILAEGVISGEVSFWESYWISNAFYAEASKAFILSLEDRNDIELIVKNEPMQSLYFDPKPGIGPTLSGTDLGLGVPKGLEVIGADSMWALGYNGEGTLIASFDTGVDGTHPALSGSWRGNNGYSAVESWFDPIDQTSTPTWGGGSVFSSELHGTWTMGILVGKDDATGDTTGVAWGAQWISAKVINIRKANFISAFQWAADPDGDPNTSDDVPDVLNNSWGFTQDILGCNNLFWSSIDNLEALGTVCVFAGGNSGADGSMSMTNPANRATNEFNTFSVGSIDPHNPLYPIWFSSSRGPSDCDGVSIKPEVVAPGRNIRSTRPLQAGSDGYVDDLTGTSMAAPHVAGAVALLRQYNPNASVEDIKSALMNSAVDLGTAGEDNNYGNGLIYIPAALALLPENNEINIYVKSVNNPAISDGDTIEVVVTLKNSGAGAVNVSGELTNSDSEISILDGFSSFTSNMPMGSVADNSPNPFQLVFDQGLTEGDLLSATLEITADGVGYSNIVKIYFRVGSKQEKSIFTHISDSLEFTVSNYGSYGLAPGSAFENGGVGFSFPANSPNGLFRCGLMIGINAEQVSDGITHHIGWVEQDFAIAPGGNLVDFANGELGDIETFSRMNDNNATYPIGITIEQRTASFTTAPNTNYIILEYVISNSSQQTINGIYVGLFFDWDFPTGGFGFDRSGFDQSLDLGYMWDDTSPDYRGTAVLSSQGATSYSTINNADYFCQTCPGLTEIEKYNLLTAGLGWSAIDSAYDQAMTIATGPYNLSPGEQDTATFAIIATTNLLGLQALTQTAYQTYREFTPVIEDDSPQLPKGYTLLQNYPNPFNPETQITFSLAKPGRVTIDVFNILGQKIVTLMDQEQNVGYQTIFWDGRDFSNAQVASGIYFYRLISGEFSDIKKMILMK